MATFGAVKAALADWIGAANATRFPDAVRGDLINLARRELTRLHDLRFNEVSDTMLTTAAVRDYAVPQGWSRPHTLWYDNPDTGAIVVLSQLAKERFDLSFPRATTTGLPSAYTVWAGTIQLGATPDRTLTINRNYYRVLPDLINDPDEDDLMKNAWEVVLFKALVHASQYLIEDPRALVWQARANVLEDQLIIEHARGRTSGRRAAGQEPG